MASYTAPQIAKEHGIDPKELRRFIRSSKTWNTVGTGRRYTFSEGEARSLIRGFKSWKSSRQAVKTKRKTSSV